jgi:predicted membrane-bound mannosyltransferase
MTVLEPTGEGSHVGKFVAGIDRHLYSWMPYPFLIHAVWFKIFGPSIFSLRAVSLLFGPLALGACWTVVNRLTRKPGAALLAVFLLGVDYAFVFAAADGRPDMIAGSLSMAAMAAYFTLREGNLTRAVLISQALQAAAVFCHPNAAIGLCGLVAGALWLPTNTNARPQARHRSWLLSVCWRRDASAGSPAGVFADPTPARRYPDNLCRLPFVWSNFFEI